MSDQGSGASRTPLIITIVVVGLLVAVGAFVLLRDDGDDGETSTEVTAEDGSTTSTAADSSTTSEASPAFTPPSLAGELEDFPWEELGLDMIQPHGERPIADYAALDLPYIWVIRGTPALDSLRVPTPAPARVLLDAAVEGFGGAGIQTDWGWAREAVAALAPHEVWLAGGIKVDNAASAVAEVGPAGLDVASGSERDGARRGEKDRDRIAALVDICRRVRL